MLENDEMMGNISKSLGDIKLITIDWELKFEEV